jgi:hypothetical protein
MTTIAGDAKKGVMVCDSRTQIDGQWWPCTKVHRVGEWLVGGAGDSGTIRRFIKWFENGRKTPHPKMPDNFCMLSLGPDGLIYWSAAMIPEPIERGFHAIGSGGNAALGAMMNGADCKRAVEIACLIDTGTGGEVVVHKLKA